MGVKGFRRAAVVAGVVFTMLWPGAAWADTTTVMTGVLPSGRSLTSAVWDGTNAYVFGGQVSIGVGTDQIVRYNPATDTVTTMTAVLPSARFGTSAIYDGTYAYVFGGITASGATNEIVRYDPATDSATVVATLPSARYYPSAVWDGVNAYVFGGVAAGGVTSLKEIVRFNPATSTVTTMAATLPTNRWGTSAAFDGVNAYVIGGNAGSGPITQIVRYNPTTGVVTTLSSTLPNVRSYTASLWDGTNVFTFAGQNSQPSPNNITTDITRFNPTSGAVDTMNATFSSGRYGLGAVWTGSTAYLFGGTTGTTQIVRYTLTPGAPQSPGAAAGAGAGQITLTWQPPASNTYSGSVTSYRIYRGTASGGETFLADAGTALTYTDSGLGNSQARYYKVSAVTSSGEGVLSGEVSATTFAVPSTPQNPSAAPGPGAGQLSLSWQGPASDGGTPITNYRIFRSTTATGTYAQIAQIGTTTSYVDSGIGNNTTRWYKVAAVNAAGASAMTAAVSATTYDTPSAPQGVSAATGPGVGAVTVSWAAPASDGGLPVTNFRVYRGTSATGPFTQITEVGAATLSFTDTGLDNGATAYYTVAARNAAGVGIQSAVASATTVEPPPRSLTASAGPGLGEVTLAWRPPAGSGTATTYRVYRRLAGGIWVFVRDAGTPLTFTDTHRALGLTYHYAVTAVNNGNESPLSNEANALGTGVPNVRTRFNADDTVTVYADQDGDGAVGPDETYFRTPSSNDSDYDGIPDDLEPTLCANQNTTLLSDGHCNGGTDYVAPTPADVISDLMWLAVGQRP